MKRKYCIAAMVGGFVMLGLCLSGGTAQFPTKKNLLTNAQPAPHNKTGAKTPAHSQSHYLHPKKPVKLLPDLIVEKIWLDRQGIIHFTLKNKGKGTLSKVDHARGRVKVSFGSASKTFAFKTVDPRQALIKPNGTVSYNTSLISVQANSVEVEIFFQGRLSEANIRNNILSIKLSPKRIRKIEKAKTPKPIHKVSTSQARTGTKPELFIEKAYIKDGTIHLFIKNKGRGKISSRDYRQGKVALRYGGMTRSWHIKDVDTMHHLDRRGGSAGFNTKIPFKPKDGGAGVKVTFYDFKNVKMNAFNVVPLSHLPNLGIKWVTFTHPKQGERFIKNHDAMISWYNHSKGNLVNILLMEKGSPTPMLALKSYANNNHGVNFYKWHISDTCPIGPKFKIRLKSVGGAIMGESKAFEITQEEKPDLVLSDLKIETTEGLRWLSFKLKNDNWEHAKILLTNPGKLTIQTCAMWERCLIWAPLRQREIDTLNQRGYVWIRFPWEYECDTQVILDFGHWIDESNEQNNKYILKQQGICSGSGKGRLKTEIDTIKKDISNNLQTSKSGGNRFGKPQPPVKKSTLKPGPPGRVLMPTPDGGDTGTPVMARAILAITQLSLTPEQPAKNTQATVNVTVRNKGPLDMPYRCNCSVVTMTSDRLGTRGSWGEPRVLVSANEANVPLISPNTELTIHIPVQFAEAGYHVLVTQLHVDAGHLCQTEENAQQVTVDTSAQIKMLVADVRGETAQMDLVLSEVRRDQGRLYLTMYSQGQLGTAIPNEDWNSSTLTVRIEQAWLGPPPATTMVIARISDIDSHGILRIPWAFGQPPAMQLHYVWPTRASEPTFGLDPDDLAGNKVRVELNANRSISEIEYSNNVKERTFPPGPYMKPDLVVCMPKYILLSPPVSFGFPIYVKNIGKAPNPPGGKVILRVGGHDPFETNLPVIQPNGQPVTIAVVNYTWWNKGTNHFILEVDNHHQIEESVAGEQNNILRGLIDRNDFPLSGYDTFNATHPHFCSDDPDAATPVPSVP